MAGPLVTVCARYCEQLVRSRSGSKVLEAVVKGEQELIHIHTCIHTYIHTFMQQYIRTYVPILGLHPQPVIEAIGRVYAGAKQEPFEGEEGDGEHPMDAIGDEGEEDEEEVRADSCVYLGLYASKCVCMCCGAAV